MFIKQVAVLQRSSEGAITMAVNRFLEELQLDPNPVNPEDIEVKLSVSESEDERTICAMVVYLKWIKQ